MGALCHGGLGQATGDETISDRDVLAFYWLFFCGLRVIECCMCGGRPNPRASYMSAYIALFCVMLELFKSGSWQVHS